MDGESHNTWLCENPLAGHSQQPIVSDSLQDILDTGKQQGIDYCLILPGKIPELFWEGKGDQVVLWPAAACSTDFRSIVSFHGSGSGGKLLWPQECGI